MTYAILALGRLGPVWADLAIWEMDGFKELKINKIGIQVEEIIFL